VPCRRSLFLLIIQLAFILRLAADKYSFALFSSSGFFCENEGYVLFGKDQKMMDGTEIN
jgi:hypothetical protein